MAQTIKAADGSVYTLEGNILVHSYNANTGETKYFASNGRLHRRGDAPARTVEVNGMIVLEEYYYDGDLHRKNGPARVLRGDKLQKEWFKHDLRHCETGPAYHKISGARTINKYYINGKLHRLDGPAHTVQVGDVLVVERYYEYGKLYRRDGPACIYRNEDGTIAGEYYYIAGVLSRKDGPAMIAYHEGAPVYTAEYSGGVVVQVNVSVGGREIMRIEEIKDKMVTVVNMPVENAPEENLLVENNARLSARLEEEVRSHDETKRALGDLLNANAELRAELDAEDDQATKYALAWKKERDTTTDLRATLARMTARAMAAESRLRESEQEYRECVVDWVALKQKLAAAAEREAELRSALDDNKAKIAAIKQAIE